MANKFRGVMQSPVTPLKDGFGPDLQTFERLLDFHLHDPFDRCRQDRLFEARKVQEDVAALRQLVKKGGAAALKSAVRAMGRSVGEVRPPLQALAAGDRKKLAARLAAFAPLATEPRGW